MNKNYNSDAYVIHIRAYRNTSALVDFFTRSHGLIRVVANGLYGSRKQQLHWQGALRPLQPMTVYWRGERALKTLIDVDGQTRSLVPLEGQFLYCGFYVNELLQRCLGDIEEDAAVLFQAYQLCIEALAQKQDMQTSLRRFELSLLYTLGYGIDFSHCADGQVIEAEKYYQFEVHRGFTQTQQHQQFAIAGKYLLALQQNDFSHSKVKAVAKYILHAALSPHIGSKALISKGLFKNI